MWWLLGSSFGLEKFRFLNSGREISMTWFLADVQFLPSSSLTEHAFCQCSSSLLKPWLPSLYSTLCRVTIERFGVWLSAPTVTTLCRHPMTSPFVCGREPGSPSSWRRNGRRWGSETWFDTLTLKNAVCASDLNYTFFTGAGSRVWREYVQRRCSSGKHWVYNLHYLFFLNA